MSTTNLPHRFRENQFKRYEPYIVGALAVLPAPFTIPASPLVSSETVSCRLRDAMRSYAQFNWDSSIDRAKFDAVYERLEIALLPNGDVQIRLRQARPAAPPQRLVLANCTSPEHLLAAVRLCSAGFIPQGILFTGAHDVALLQHYSEDYNISVEPTPDGTLVL